MLSTGLVSFLFAIGVAGWTYTKMEKRLGQVNMQNILIVSAVAFVVAFLVFFTVFKYVFNF